VAHFRAEANEALSSLADLDAALQVCAEAAVRHLDAAFARIWLLDPNEELLTLHASAGLYTHRDGAHGHIPVGQFKIGIIAAARQPFLTNAVATDPQISDPAWAQQEGMVAFAGYPLLAGGRLVGVLALFAQQPLPEDTLDALATIATTIANGVARRQAEQALQASEADLARSNTDLERFAYVVSHDLQEPLRMVSLFVDLLGQEYRGKLDANADEYIRYAVEGAKRMHRQIQDLLAYSRIETHGAPLHPTDATDAFTGALWNLDTAIADAAAVVTHDPLPMVLADPPQLTLLFQNLIGNAIKFRSEAPPCIHIAVRRLAGQDTAAPAWEFAVRDNGIGIEPQYRERIFGVFQRLHTQQAYPGTGIGLAICQRIVERHGGRIWVESEEGQGATFFFTLVPAEPA
jgi:signal transduction histidine kinase